METVDSFWETFLLNQSYITFDFAGEILACWELFKKAVALVMLSLAPPGEYIPVLRELLVDPGIRSSRVWRLF